jgi:zinc protease
MQRHAALWSLSIFFACCFFAGSLSFGQVANRTQSPVGPAAAKPSIPSHPRALKYKPLQYTPPKASAYRQVLNNGVVGFLVEEHDLPLVTVSAVIRVGPYLDPEEKKGLSAATANQLRSGGTAHYKAEVFDEEVDFIAAEIASSVGPTSGGASINFMAKDTEKALSLFFDMLRNPAFQQDRLDLYKSQVLQAIERRNDRTDEIENREWNRLLRGEKHYTSVYSTKASLSSLTRDDLIDFHRKYYHPGNIILAISGDFQTAEMKSKLEKAMEGWANSGMAVPKAPKPDFTPEPGVYMVNKPDVNQGRVSIGHLGIMRGNPDEYAIDMMNEILGGSGFTSRITSRVRTDEGLAYDAGSSFSSGVYYPGLFRAGLQSKSSTAAQAAQIVLDEIQRMCNEKATADELETVKNQAIEIFPRYFASAASIADTFARDEYTGRAPDFWDTYRDKVKAVTIADVQRVARQYLHPDKLVILVVGNTDEIMKGNPDKPEYSFKKMANGRIVQVPLPDPATMIYPTK